MHRRTVAGAAIVALMTVGVTVPAAVADEDSRRGRCSGTADWRLEVKSDDGRLEVEAEVDSPGSGQRWRWRLWHNGSVSASGRATTSWGSGSFEVERRMSDLAGRDTIRLRATHRGQVCRGRVAR